MLKYVYQLKRRPNGNRYAKDNNKKIKIMNTET